MPAYRQAINTPLAPPHSVLRHTSVLTTTDTQMGRQTLVRTNAHSPLSLPSKCDSGGDANYYWLLRLFSPPSFFVDLPCFSCLFQHFSQSLKSCRFPSLRFLEERWLFPFLTYSSRGNRSCNALPAVQWRVNVLFMAKGISIMLSGKSAAERWLGCRWCWNKHRHTRSHTYTEACLWICAQRHKQIKYTQTDRHSLK